MARNGSGQYLKIFTAQPGTTIEAADFNGHADDVAVALTGSMPRNGEAGALADLPMGTYKLLNVGDAAARNQYASAGQVQDSSLRWCGTFGGTGNAITGAPTPAITAYAAGQVFRGIISADNTGATTITLDGSNAKNVYFLGAACVGGEFVTGDVTEFVYDGTQFHASVLRRTLVAATGGAAGSAGLAPAADAGEQTYYLTGAATYSRAGIKIDFGVIDLSADTEFTDLPAGLIRLDLYLASVLPDQSSNLGVQLGESGAGYAATGYSGYNSVISVGTNANSTMFIFRSQSGAALAWTGKMELTHMGSNKWTQTTNGILDATTAHFLGAGSVTLAGELDRLKPTFVTGGTGWTSGLARLIGWI